MRVKPSIRLPWSSGPERLPDVAVVTATKFTFASSAAALLASPRALRFWATWRRVPGAVGISVRYDPFARAAWTLSVWVSPSDLDDFLRSPAHREAMSVFRDRLVGRSHTWEAADFNLARSWRHAADVLAGG